MQSPGAYAIVNAIKNNPESTLIEIELTVRLRKQKEDSFLLLQMSHHLMIHFVLSVANFTNGWEQGCKHVCQICLSRESPCLLCDCCVTFLRPTFVVIVFQDITVNNDFIELCKEVQHLRSNMKISHGGTGGADFKPKARPTPMKILKNYIEDNQMRLLDLFNTLDKDKSMNITVKEFADGLKVSFKDKTLLFFKSSLHNQVKTF